MKPIWMLIPVILPMLGGLALAAPGLRLARARNAFTLVITLLSSVCALPLTLYPPDTALTLVRLSEELTIALRIDGLSRIYTLIIALLWPVTAVYAFDYMHKEEHLNRFFGFFLASYGIAAGIAFAANLVTMYLFFELLTLATLPLVMHRMDDAARFAAKRYLIFSMTGAALGLIGVVFCAHYGWPADFTPGGVLRPDKILGHEAQLRLAWVLAFFGFGVKAALLPLSVWLPTASVAPTPVTALLHAVAVVKAGVFACIRLTQYSFGTALLLGTAAQKIVLCAVVLTIVTGSLLALRNNHLKRRLAWSTVANLSYILLGVALMTDAGLLAASQHMLNHAFIKIALFFAVGIMMERAKCAYVDELEGLSRRLPVTFACFVIAALALIGVPPMPGFFSKWAIGVAAAETGTALGIAGVIALMLSAVLTALYLITVIIPAYFPLRQVHSVEGARLESRGMTGALLVCTVAVVALGLFSGSVRTLLAQWLLGGGVK